MGKPLDKEQELSEKAKRLGVLNGLLNVDKKCYNMIRKKININLEDWI